jgi:hypothetical protein
MQKTYVLSRCANNERWKYIDGIIGDVKEDRITMLVGEDVIDQENQMNQDYRSPYGFRYPARRYRVYRPRIYPLANLAALSLLPYPYVAPPYPYY